MTQLWGEEKLAQTYLLSNKTELWEKYKFKYPDSIKRTTFFNAIKTCHYEHLKVLRGLCSVCDNWGFRTFTKLDHLLDFILEMVPNATVQVHQLHQRIKALHQYLRKDFIHHLNKHDKTATHCMQRCFATTSNDMGALGAEECSCLNEVHEMDCANCNDRILIFQELYELVDKFPDKERERYKEKVKELDKALDIYVGHLMRTVHQRAVLTEYLQDLPLNQCVSIMDFKMKYIFQLFRENCSSWYGKKGATIWGKLYFFRTVDTPVGSVEMAYYDNISELDSRQDWYMVASALEATAKSFKLLYPHITEEYAISDNGPHFHNTSLMLWCGLYYEVCAVVLVG